MLYKQKFNSVTEMRNFINATKINGYYGANYIENSHATGASAKSFRGTADYDEADKLLQYGWAEGAKRVNAYMQQSNMLGYIPRWSRVVDYNGGSVAIGRYLTGQPKCRVSMQKRPVIAPVVDICYNCSVGVSITTNEIEAAAAKLLNVVSGMERGGIRVNLYVCRHTQMRGKSEILSCVKIKDAGQPFNVLSVAYPLAHPSMMRRHFCAVHERANISDKHGLEEYGYSVTDTAKTKNALAQIGISPKNVLNYYVIADKTEKQIADMLI